MPDVRFDHDGLWVGGRRCPLIAAQCDLHHHNPLHWPRILDAIRDAGIPVVSTSICWDFHRAGDGAPDLRGTTDPSRDLARFLDLCAERELVVLARPGPLIGPSWETGGPPEHLAASDVLDSAFLAEAERWLRDVGALLAEREATGGGAVAMVGIDHPAVRPQPPVPGWPDLASTPPDVAPAGAAHERFRLAGERASEFVARCAAVVRAAGVTVPVFSNAVPAVAAVSRATGREAIATTGADVFTAAQPSPRDLLLRNWWYRVQRSRSRYPWAADLQCGGDPEAPECWFMQPEALEQIPMTAQAAGLRGVSFHMFIERGGWFHSPVNATGKIRAEREERVRAAVASLRAAPAVSQQLADVGLIWTPTDAQVAHLDAGRDWRAAWEHGRRFTTDVLPAGDAWWEAFEGLAGEDLDFRLWIPGEDVAEPPGILVYAGAPRADAADLQPLRQAVERRPTTLVEVTPLPVHDLASRPSRELEALAAEIRGGAVGCRAAAADLPLTLVQLGARTYVRSGSRGVWTYLYRTSGRALVLGVWNASAERYHGPVELSRLAVDADRVHTVHEPRRSRSWQAEGAALASIPADVEPGGARVYVIES